MPKLDNNSLIPAARVQLWDSASNFVARVWYRWFYNIYVSVEAARRYGDFYSTATFTPAAPDVGYPLTFSGINSDQNGNPLVYGLYIGTPNSRIYVDNTAVYNIQFSTQVVELATGNKQIYFWPRINGIDINNAALKTTLSGGVGYASVISNSFMLSLTNGSYVELIYAVDDINIQIAPVAASGNLPAIPSVVMTITSNIGV